MEDISDKIIRLKKTRCTNLNFYKTLDPKKLIEKSGVLSNWQNYSISNFEYLMHVNFISGRSY